MCDELDSPPIASDAGLCVIEYGHRRRVGGIWAYVEYKDHPLGRRHMYNNLDRWRIMQDDKASLG